MDTNTKTEGENGAKKSPKEQSFGEYASEATIHGLNKVTRSESTVIRR